MTGCTPSEGVVVPNLLTFSSMDWNRARTVTVTGNDDGVMDGDQDYMILTDSAVSTDSNYNGVNMRDVGVVNLDTDSLDCSTLPVVLEDVEYTTDTMERSEASITSEGTVIVKDGVNVVYSAPFINIEPGFMVEYGGQFSANTMVVDCGTF